MDGRHLCNSSNIGEGERGRSWTDAFCAITTTPTGISIVNRVTTREFQLSEGMEERKATKGCKEDWT